MGFRLGLKGIKLGNQIAGGDYLSSRWQLMLDVSSFPLTQSHGDVLWGPRSRIPSTDNSEKLVLCLRENIAKGIFNLLFFKKKFSAGQIKKILACLGLDKAFFFSGN